MTADCKVPKRIDMRSLLIVTFTVLGLVAASLMAWSFQTQQNCIGWGKPCPDKSPRVHPHKSLRVHPDKSPGVHPHKSPRVHPYKNPMLYYVVDKSVVICLLPKVASTVMLMLTKRLNGVPTWNSTQMTDIRTNRRTEFVQLSDLHNPSIKKIALVRNPVGRVLSGYLNKIINNRAYKLLPEGSWPLDKNAEPPTFEEFLDILDAVPLVALNKHFRPQSLLCDTDRVSYTLLDYRDREAELKNFLTSIGRWEDAGASGWGPNGTAPIFAEMEHIKVGRGDIRPATVTGDQANKIKEYYTADILNKVFRMYAKDFEAFRELGWSMDPDSYLNP